MRDDDMLDLLILVAIIGASFGLGYGARERVSRRRRQRRRVRDCPGEVVAGPSPELEDPGRALRPAEAARDFAMRPGPKRHRVEEYAVVRARDLRSAGVGCQAKAGPIEGDYAPCWRAREACDGSARMRSASVPAPSGAPPLADAPFAAPLAA